MDQPQKDLFSATMCSEFYEKPDYNLADLRAKLDTLPGDSVYGSLLDALVLNSSAHDQNKYLLKEAKTADLRTRLAFMLGMRLNWLDTCQRGLWNKGGEYYYIRQKLTFEEAASMAPLLEVPISQLMKSKPMGLASHRESPWFYGVDYINRNEFHLVDKQQTPFFRSGRFKISDTKLEAFDVGVAILYIPRGYVQLSFTVADNVQPQLAEWESRLTKLGSEFGIVGPSVFSVASQFLTRSPVKIYRMSWMLQDTPGVRTLLYSRVLSPRCEEMTFHTKVKTTAFPDFKQPLPKKNLVVPALHRFLTSQPSPTIWGKTASELEKSRDLI